MPPLKTILLLIAIIVLLPACAPRVAVKPAASDTPPEKLFEMARAQEAGLKGLRASVKVTFQAEGQSPVSFDAVLYVARPDKVRLTGLAMMGVTAFDVLLSDDKFYFYQPSDGMLYTGRREAVRGFLEGMGVKADPEVMYKSLFMESRGELDRYFLERTEAGYNIFQVVDQGGVIVPRSKTEYDMALQLKRKVFYDELARPYLFVQPEGFTTEGGFRLPQWLIARDTANGYSITVAFEKYIVNPEGMENDFTIQGGELKGIKEVE
jgi:hypothetical protein